MRRGVRVRGQLDILTRSLEPERIVVARAKCRNSSAHLRQLAARYLGAQTSDHEPLARSSSLLEQRRVQRPCCMRERALARARADASEDVRRACLILFARLALLLCARARAPPETAAHSLARLSQS